MANNKYMPGFIPNVDIIKSGVQRVNPVAASTDSDGLVRMTRTKSGEESRNRAITRELAEHEDKLKRLKEIADGYGLSKKDIKEVKQEIDDDDYEKIKKKDKKELKLDPYFSALISSGSMPDDFAEYVRGGGEEGEKKKKKKKKKKNKERNNIQGLNVKEKKDKNNDKDKHKRDKEENEKNKSEVAARFKEVEKISRDNIKEIDETMDLINSRLRELNDSGGERMKSRDYIMSNYLSSKTALISARQKVATDILSNRAKIYEIEMKREKSSKENANSDADLIAKLFPGIVLDPNANKNLGQYINKNGKNKDSKKKKHKHDYDDIKDDDELDNREHKLIKNGDIEYSDYDENIEWEGNFKVAIKKAYTTGEWKFIAIDEDGNFIKGFPKSHLPPKKTSQMKFDDEKDMAIDINSNKAYQVFQVPSI